MVRKEGKMLIRHKETGKVVILTENGGLMGGYRERVALAAQVAMLSKRFADGQEVTGHYSGCHDKWYTTAGNFRISGEASASHDTIDAQGFTFVDDVEEA